MSVIPNFSNNLFPQSGVPGLGGTNLSTATALAGLSPQSLLGSAFTNNPALNSILMTLQAGAQTGFAGFPSSKVDSFTPVGGQPNILAPGGTPPAPALSGGPMTPGTLPGVSPIPGALPGTPPVPGATTPPTPGAPTVIPPVTPTPGGGQTLQEIQAKALAEAKIQAQAPPPVQPVPGGNNLLIPPTSGLPPTSGTPGGINPLATPSPSGLNSLLGGAGGSSSVGIGQLMQLLVQLLMSLQQQPPAPATPPPTAAAKPLDPRDAKIAELEKKITDLENKKTDNNNNNNNKNNNNDNNNNNNNNNNDNDSAPTKINTRSARDLMNLIEKAANLKGGYTIDGSVDLNDLTAVTLSGADKTAVSKLIATFGVYSGNDNAISVSELQKFLNSKDNEE